MRTVSIEHLTTEAFAPYGQFVDMAKVSGEHIGAKPIQFYRDMVLLPNTTPMSFSICRVEKRDMVVDVTEMHSFCYEGGLCLDADTVIHVGPATPNGVCPVEKFRAFFIPKGMFFTVKPGVWHHANFLFDTKAKSANVLVVLPERTYANDCKVVELDEAKRIRIDAKGFKRK